MNIFFMAAGVASGILIAAVVIGCAILIHRKELAGEQEDTSPWMYAGVALPLIWVGIMFYLGT